MRPWRRTFVLVATGRENCWSCWFLFAAEYRSWAEFWCIPVRSVVRWSLVGVSIRRRLVCQGCSLTIWRCDESMAVVFVYEWTPCFALLRQHAECLVSFRFFWLADYKRMFFLYFFEDHFSRQIFMVNSLVSSKKNFTRKFTIIPLVSSQKTIKALKGTCLHVPLTQVPCGEFFQFTRNSPGEKAP